MSLLTWVLVGILAYTLAVMLLKRRGLIPSYLNVSGPITTLHTKRGRAFLDWLAGPRRFWRAWGNLGVGITLVVMVGTFALLVFQGLSILQNPPAPTQVNQPQNFLVIPGVNDFLPLSVAPEIIAGLVIGLIVHEGGHGLLCYVEDIDVDSMGLAFFAFSTMLSWSYYGVKAWTYLVGEGTAKENVFKVGFCLFTVIGAAAQLGAVIDFSDAMIFAMAVVNIIALYVLMPMRV